MKFQEKTFIVVIATLLMICLVAGCSQSDNPVGQENPTENPAKTNAPVFHYRVSKLYDGTYSLTVTARNAEQKNITGKVWAMELWSAQGEQIVPKECENKADLLEKWQEGTADSEVYYTGIARTTKILPAGWYAIRGSYYESGIKINKSGLTPPFADQYSADSLAPEKSQWYYFHVERPL